MSMKTHLDAARRMFEELMSRLPQPLLDRLLFLRQAYPKTPLNSLPEPVRREVKKILTTAGATSAKPATSYQPVLLNGQAQSRKRTATTAPPGPADAGTTDVSILGTAVVTGRDIVISRKERQQGLYVLGTNGTGKTTLLEHLILTDIRNRGGICLVEPHGDLTAQILAGIPQHRLKDVIYLDVEDWEYPFGLNIFECPPPRTIREMAATASFVQHTFARIWGAGTETPRLTQNLRAVTRTLIENPGTTFSEIPLLYSNDYVRQQMLANLSNTSIVQFWEDYTRKTQRDKDTYIESTMNKVQAFLDEPMIRNIVSQSKTTIKFRNIMDEGKILLVKLSPQFEEASMLIGAVIIGQILMAAFSRADTPEDKRKDFYLYCDEFQRFATSDFATLISEARKFRIATTLSHQTLAQLDESNRTSAIAAGNLIVFRVSGDDAKALARNYDYTPVPVVIGEEPIRSPVSDVITHLVRRGHTDQRVTQFAQKYLQKLENYLHDGPERRFACSYECFAGALILTDFQLQTGRSHLNDCLFRCMSEGNANIPIPPLAIYVLATSQGQAIEYVFSPYLKTCSSEFFGPHYLQEFRQDMARFGDPLFLTRAPGFVSAQGKKEKWMAEAIVKMLTDLRYTMTQLAEHPILVDTGQYIPKFQNRTYQDMENQIARDLTNQPNFTAKVKLLSGEHVIHTKPPPEVLTGDFLTQRINAIKRQMQTLGYTRHYTEVEQEIRERQERYQGTSDEPPPPSSFSLD